MSLQLSDFASAQSLPHTVNNLLGGKWVGSATSETVVDPLNGSTMLTVPRTAASEIQPFIDSLAACPKTGMHNPFRNVDRYLMLGGVSARAASALRTPAILDYFTKLIMRTSPKSYPQAKGEVTICAQFLENFSGDNVRYLARSFGNPGDHDGQESRGYRFPYGPTAIITPFNFPLEIPVLQLMGALYMGNKPLLKVDSKTAVVMEQFLRLLHACGLPTTDVDFINTDGPTMHKLLMKAQPRMTLFTGSSRVSERLAKDLRGRLKVEDAGFDWKIIGPDVPVASKTLGISAAEAARQREYVAWVCDQDAYACSGQKCSAQSMLFVHRNWVKAGLLDNLAKLAARRKLDDLTIGPVLTWTTEAMQEHIEDLTSELRGARVLFGGKELPNHTIPKQFGALEPTAVFVPLRSMRGKKAFELATSEVFGPVQVVTEYTDKDIPLVLEMCERMSHHLTAAVVSKDEVFRQRILGSTVNGTTYSGLRARTTGAPQNHWFGPAGDPRGAGIGTKEAIQLVWSCHREVISDVGPLPANWTLPAAT